MIRISKPIVREVDRKVFLVSYMSDNKVFQKLYRTQYLAPI